MADTVGLHDLIGSVAGAIVDAQGVVERHFIDQLGRYFDAEGRPISFGIKVPSASSTAADGAYSQLSVPLLSLVETNLLAIREMTVDLDVELGDLSARAPAMADDLAPMGAPRDVPAMAIAETANASMAPQATPALFSPQAAMALSVGVGGRTDASGPMAHISITVEAKPVSEGLLRLLTQLNKSV